MAAPLNRLKKTFPGIGIRKMKKCKGKIRPLGRVVVKIAVASVRGLLYAELFEKSRWKKAKGENDDD